MTRIDYNHLINRIAFWLLVIAIAVFTMSPFAYALSISFRTNPQVLIEARYLPEATNFERQYNLDRLQIINVENPGGIDEYIELQNIGPRPINLDGWRLTSSESYELRTITNVFDPNEPEQNYTSIFQGLGLKPKQQELQLRGTRPINDVGSVFVAVQRNFPPDTVAMPLGKPTHLGAVSPIRNIERWNEINNIKFEFDVVVDYFTRFEFPEFRIQPGQILRIYTGEGQNSAQEIYMGFPYEPEVTPSRPFTGRLWEKEGTVITLTNDRGIQETTYTVGSGRIERVQIVDQADIGIVEYEDFAEFFDTQVLTGERLITFLAQFGGTAEPDEDWFRNLEDVDEIEDALLAYGEVDNGFDVDAAIALVDTLSDANTAEEFSAALLGAGFDSEFVDPIVAEGASAEGERIVIRNFGLEPVNLEGWRVTNTQNQRYQFTLPSFTLLPNTTVEVVTGYGLNSDEALFLNNERSVWEEKQVSNLTDANGLRRSSYIIGGEVYALRNYSNLVKDDTFLRNLQNSAIVASVSVTLSLVVGSFAAYALGRVRFRGQYIILYLVLAMTMFPQISILSGMFQIVNELDIYNTNLAMIFSYPLFTLPFTVWVLTSFFQGLPTEIEQAALVDGATAFQTFWRILVPLTAPALVTTGLLAFIAAWNEYLFALTFTLGEKSRTVPVAIAQFSGFDREDPTADKIAAAVVVTIPLLVLVLVFQRRIVEGLTAGAVKG